MLATPSLNFSLLPDFRLVPSDQPEPPESCDPLGLYAETYWLPRLEPAAFVLGRRLVAMWTRHASRSAEPLMASVQTLRSALGLRSPTRLLSALQSVEKAGLARVRGGAVVEVRLRWPRLPSDGLAQLPREMRLAEPDHWALESQPVTTGFAF